jgi:Reverse transcriptase (RNA-dependent DNA polymerase)
VNDILHAIDREDVAAPVLLDLSAAFDSVDHEILLKRMSVSFGNEDAALRWFWYYLTNQKQFVRANISPPSDGISGVTQGSVLGPFLFILYIVHLVALIEKGSLSMQLHADDSQFYVSSRSSRISQLATQFSDCTTYVAEQLRSNRLLLNAYKTDVLWGATRRRRHQLPTSGLIIDGVPVSPSTMVSSLGILLDADLSETGVK